ncbi:hypothetical protein J4G37_58555, partial [Microvirga sp. 3-52]|nr:hypothetical protein [Microvirga sp. 3-52]
YIEEAANSDYVVVMKKGEIIAKGTPEHLKNEYASDKLLLTAINDIDMRKILDAEKIEYSVEKSFFYLPLQETKSAIPFLAKHVDLISSFEVRKSSLDDVFLAIN